VKNALDGRLDVVACALVRAASRLVGMLGEHPRSPRFSAGRREESRRGTHECVRHDGPPILSRVLYSRPYWAMRVASIMLDGRR
jgi:hypothetical protein